MSALSKKIDFTVIFTVKNANPNGDPLNGNRPRETSDGFGEVSDVCIKRKLRNRLQDMGERIFVQSDDRCDDGFDSLRARAQGQQELWGGDRTAYQTRACKLWYDVRAFGQVFAFSGGGTGDGVSVGVRGPVSIHPAISANPIEIESIQITKSVNSESGDKRSSDTMGTKHRIGFGVYRFNGSINCQLAEKTGFSDEDAQKLKQALITLFENDASSARPEGSMEVRRVIWWEHSCKSGDYPSAKVHRSVRLVPKSKNPASFEEYDIVIDPLEGLTPDVWEGQ
ncbi:MAG: type I-C CRISPR-associated protein Cas7/Csd2 [Christensenellales bacterium]|jgi:CRISPR-associated protein Csd2